MEWTSLLPPRINSLPNKLRRDVATLSFALLYTMFRFLSQYFDRPSIVEQLQPRRRAEQANLWGTTATPHLRPAVRRVFGCFPLARLVKKELDNRHSAAGFNLFKPNGLLRAAKIRCGVLCDLNRNFTGAIRRSDWRPIPSNLFGGWRPVPCRCHRGSTR